MTEENRKQSPIRSLLVRHRRWLIGIAAAIFVYALLGFLLAPWLVQKIAIDTVRENYEAELGLGRVAINPFTLTLTIEALAFDDPAGEPVLRVGRVFVDFQASSLFRWAWTFAEISFDRPEVFARRDGAGEFNFAFLLEERAAPEAQPTDGSGGPPRLIIRDFAISDAIAHWDDLLPPDPVDTTFGPIDIQVLALNTLPDRAGEQDVVIRTETAGTFSWSGSIELNPFSSSGRASIEGSHFDLLSPYIRYETGIDIAQGDADVGLDYAVKTLADGGLSAAIDNFELTLAGVQVRTFASPDDDDPRNRDLLSLPTLSIAGGTFRWPEREVSVESVGIDDAVLALYRNADGELDIVPTQATVADEPAADPAPADADPWRVSLDRFDIRRMAVGWIDDSVAPAADLGVEDLALTVTGISNEPGTRFPVSVSFSTRASGSVEAEGGVIVLPDPVADLEISVADAALELLHPYIKPLADVHLDSGTLNFDGAIATSPEQPLRLTGNADIVDFLITETDEGTRLGSWERFAISNIALSLADSRLEVSELVFDAPYADIFIAADGSVNLGRIGKDELAGAGADESSIAESPGTDDAPPFDVTIGRVSINDGAAAFADESLPLPFAASIAELNGRLTTIATSSSEPAEVGLEGKVDQFGQVTVSGTVTPLDPKRDTDVRVVFENVEMPKFSAYTIQFAGREIASGRLDLNLGYALQQSELVGENKIVLREFELGDSVPHPGAMSLPLSLAVALLKDPSGRIDVDLPVRGNVDDPEFRIGGLIGKALVNLIVKIVASPFALLGNLIGVEASEIDSIAFPPGRADLTPPEQETAARLAEALALRPELKLDIPGVYAAEADALALRTAAVDAKIDAAIAARGDGDKQYPELQLEITESLFSAAGASPDPAAALDAIRAGFRVIPEGGDERDAELDRVAYAAELRRRLIEAESLPDAALAVLAGERAANTRAAILAADPALDSRVVILDPEPVEAGDGEVVMKVRLEAGEN